MEKNTTKSLSKIIFFNGQLIFYWQTLINTTTGLSKKSALRRRPSNFLDLFLIFRLVGWWQEIIVKVVELDFGNILMEVHQHIHILGIQWAPFVGDHISSRRKQSLRWGWGCWNAVILSCTVCKEWVWMLKINEKYN